MSKLFWRVVTVFIYVLFFGTTVVALVLLGIRAVEALNSSDSGWQTLISVVVVGTLFSLADWLLSKYSNTKPITGFENEGEEK